tara:strand:+ start:454 stop:654 length:201 start_codon:yes stop_codon:yes gene_type:complete
MYVLVLIAYMIGEEPTIKASPVLYETYDSCIDGAARAMTDVYRYLPKEFKQKVYILPMCNALPEDL